jgi:hypothetical protein
MREAVLLGIRRVQSLIPGEVALDALL